MTFDVQFFLHAFPRIVAALPTTILITLLAVIFSVFIGAALTLLRARRVPLLGHLAHAYVSVIRGTPGVLHLMVITLAAPMAIDWLGGHWGDGSASNRIPMFVFALVALSLTAATYMAEIIRSGLLAVPPGQLEAASMIGMTNVQALRRIVLPQALMASLPSLCNLVIGVLHGSSLLYLVSVREITGTAMVIASREWKFIESYVAVAILYWGITLLVERGVLTSEHRWNKRIRGRV